MDKQVESVNWNLSDLYEAPDSDEVKKDKQVLLEKTQEFQEKYRNKIESLNENEFLEAVKEYESIVEKIAKLNSYFYLLWTTNTQNEKYGAKLQEFEELSSRVDQELIFFSVEWKNLSDERQQELIESEELQDYKHFLETSLQYKPHTLSEKEEKVLSAKSTTASSAWSRFFDQKLSSIRYEVDGEEMSQEEALQKLRVPDRETRKEAHRGFTEGLEENVRDLSFVFNTVLLDKQTNDRLKNYENWIQSRNLSNQIDKKSVDALVDTVTNSYNLVQDFYELKKDLLGYDKLYDYDRYAPILNSQTEFSWEEAKDIVLSAYGEFHPRMREVAEKFFENNWIDAEMKEGKRGGAYAAPTVPSVHPYVFMNFGGRIRDVQTLAHELGHGVHQYLAKEQGYLESSTPLTTAETASVFGELLTFNKLMGELDSDREKLALLVNKIDDTIATVYRQICMNRFEHKIHRFRRRKGELRVEDFSRLWRETQQDMYGDSVELTDEYDLWWSYIPHFIHTPGYVYAYAFGELLVLALHEQYESGKDNFAENYLEMLSAGGSDWPENIVGKMDLDITKSSFWDKGVKSIKSRINGAKNLADKL